VRRLLDLRVHVRLVHRRKPLPELRLRCVHATRLEQDVPHQDRGARQCDQVLPRLVDGCVLLDLGHGRVGLPLVHVGHRRPEVRREPLAVVASDLEEPGVGLPRFRHLTHQDPVVPDAHVGRDEVRIDRERLLVALDRLLEAAHLHEQLRVGVVGVGVVRDQLDVLLEGPLRLHVLALEAVRVAHLVVGLRERRVDRGRLLVLRHRRGVVLPPEMEGPHQVPGALVVGAGRGQLCEAVELPRGLALGARVERADEKPLGLRRLLGQRGRLGHGVEELLGRPRRVGEADLGHREAGILRRRLLEQRPGVGGPQLLGKVAALEIEPSRLLRWRREGNLVGGSRRLFAGENEKGAGCGQRCHSGSLHVDPPESGCSKATADPR
jgi:hypothetical protein